ncbi:membrane hypothetical protein [Paraburkholderia ribeironis]|uniref:Uncharacterized protein n=1 Tax=Paraburkholderia ribeironis TaxID=1247936 RepID=A0A1N7SL75_9BURK|nr:membrane hypothetical protein [Paraburkholderia ribeironis]
MALTLAAGYTVCAALSAAWPGVGIDFLNAVFHRLDFHKLDIGVPFPVDMFVYPFVVFVVWGLQSERSSPGFVTCCASNDNGRSAQMLVSRSSTVIVLRISALSLQFLWRSMMQWISQNWFWIVLALAVFLLMRRGVMGSGMGVYSGGSHEHRSSETARPATWSMGAPCPCARLMRLPPYSMGAHTISSLKNRARSSTKTRNDMRAVACVGTTERVDGGAMSSKKRHAMPEHLCLAAYPAPHLHNPVGDIARLPEPEFIEGFRPLRSIPKQVLTDRKLLRRFCLGCGPSLSC